MTQRFLAIVNPAAGGGKSGKLAPAALERVRGLGIEVAVRETSGAGQLVHGASRTNLHYGIAGMA